MNNLAQVLKSEGREADAEPLIKRSLAIREKALGRDHPDVARSLNNLADLYQRQGRYADAEPVFKRALAIREQAVGPNHPDTVASVNNLASLYQAEGDSADALPLVERMIASGSAQLLGGQQRLGFLTALPFQLLVTEKPAAAIPETFAGYRDAAWLLKRQAVSVLPSVSSLKSLQAFARKEQGASSR